MVEPDPRLPGFEEPTLARRARKEELCPRGGFASVPLAILKRCHKGCLPRPAFVVYVALLDHLRGAGKWIVPSLRKIRAMTGMGKSTIRTWIEWLHVHGYIERRRRAGWANYISFALPDDWPPDPSRPAKMDKLAPATRAETGAGAPLEGQATGAETGAGTGAETGAGTGAETGAGTGAETGAGTEEQQLNRNNNNQGVVVDVIAELQQNAEVLRRLGIAPDAVEPLALTSGLTPLGLALLALEAGPDVQNLAGWVRSRLQAGAIGPRRRWGLKEVCEVIRRRWLTQLDGYRVDSLGVVAKWNNQGVHIYQGKQLVAVIPLNRLRELLGQISAPLEEAES